MKRYITLIAAVCAVLASCQKTEEPKVSHEETNPIDMTLNVSIASDDTKVTFEDVDNVLRTAWEVGDKVSVVAVDAGNKLLSNDVFTATSSGKSATFTGTYTNDTWANEVFVIYPALSVGSGTAESKWKSESGVLYAAYKGNAYFEVSHPDVSNVLNDPSHLKNVAVMHGQATMSGSEFDVTLAHQTYVIKLNLTFPVDGVTPNFIYVRGFDKSGTSKHPSKFGWTYFDDFTYLSSSTSMLLKNYQTISGNTATVYMYGFAGVSGRTYNVDDYFQIEAGGYVQRKTFTKETTIVNGKMYTVNVEFE
ncbi:MAG: hypothetical protein IKB85_00675 [Bacteroidales bacterium]|nr:hypothetical protein [Bacteroidales bacterium]